MFSFLSNPLLKRGQLLLVSYELSTKQNIPHRCKSLVRPLTPPTNGLPSSKSACGGETKSKRDYWEEIRIPVPWGHVAGKAWGNKNGLPVLGVHGWLDNAGSFDTIAPLLLDSLYFVAIELPGHGLSSHLPPGITYNYLEYLLTIRRIIKHFKWDKFSFIGHSLGAGLSALYAGIYPSQVERIVLLDLVKLVTNPTDDTYPKYFASVLDSYLDLEEASARNQAPTYAYEQAVDRLIRGTRNALTTESAQILMIRGAQQIEKTEKWKYNRDIRVNKFGVLRFTHEGIFQIYSQIKSPILLVKATDSPAFEPKSVTEQGIEVYKRNCPGFRMIETTGGHFFHLNKPHETVGHINSFFQNS